MIARVYAQSWYVISAALLTARIDRHVISAVLLTARIDRHVISAALLTARIDRHPCRGINRSK